MQRALGLPECATPPEEVYELAKRRGMDFVTITDHDTIDGVLEIADRPDVFVSEELTARFRGEPQAVHVLCYGITPDDHEWLQAHSGDVESSPSTCTTARSPARWRTRSTPSRRRCAAPPPPAGAAVRRSGRSRNGSRARELNRPAAIYIETHGGTGVGGSDDHAGVDIGRTWTETPPRADRRRSSSRHVRAGASSAHGEQGSAAKWAHAAMALAIRALGRGDGDGAARPARRCCGWSSA